MPYRKTPLVNGEYYHIFNRGVARQPTFNLKKDYQRFLLCLSYYRFADIPCRLSRFLQIHVEEREQILKELQKTNKQKVEIIAFCLMPNHFHILIKQFEDNGISMFLRQITDSYTRYFNTKNDRNGPIFQGAFKAVHVQTTEQLLHLSRYIHINPLASFVIRDSELFSYPWSSITNYLSKNIGFVSPEIVLNNFKDPKSYKAFLLDQVEYAKELERIKHLIVEA